MDDPKLRPDLHVGWYELHPDTSLNFQLNRWAAFGGPRWLEDVRPVLDQLADYEAWRATFVTLGERAESEGRMFHAALHFRSAEFFMTTDDPRKEPLRQRLLPMLRAANGVSDDAKCEVPFRDMRLPVWRFTAPQARRTAVIFGGFDSYIEDFFPVMTRMQAEGWNLFAFEGPGQGAVLEEQHVPLIPEWHEPVGAVLDSLGLRDVTLIGVSMGGCLAIRAAAFEPRVRQVVAFDVLADLFQIMTQEQPLTVAVALRGLIAIGARRLVDESATTLAHRNLRLEWALSQAMQVFGSATPTEAIEAARKIHTRDVSAQVLQDTLLMAGTRDHYIPLGQLWEQARLLTSARSITARVFTETEFAQAHCQIGNLPLAIRVMTAWADSLRGP
jgi:alpha-beta hydrolase superfamily lysophospholipase